MQEHPSPDPFPVFTGRCSTSQTGGVKEKYYIHSAWHMPRDLHGKSSWGFSQHFIFYHRPLWSVYICSVPDCVVGKEAYVFFSFRI